MLSIHSRPTAAMRQILLTAVLGLVGALANGIFGEGPDIGGSPLLNVVFTATPGGRGVLTCLPTTG